MKSPIENLFESDPLRLRRHHRTKHYKCIYTLCALVPAFLAFSIVFFLISYMSPRGRHMRQYQREIYEWNKYHLADAFDGYRFAIQIVTANGNNGTA